MDRRAAFCKKESKRGCQHQDDFSTFPGKCAYNIIDQFEMQEPTFSEDTFGVNEAARSPLSEASNFTFGQSTPTPLLLSPCLLNPAVDKRKPRWDSDLKLFSLEELPSLKFMEQSEPVVIQEAQQAHPKIELRTEEPQDDLKKLPKSQKKIINKKSKNKTGGKSNKIAEDPKQLKIFNFLKQKMGASQEC